MAEARKLNSLTSLRFIAAALIVVHHLRGVFGIPQDFWEPFALDNGVAFFFVLSGFILTYVYSARPRLEKRRFLLARLARLWPAHVAALGILMLLSWPIVRAQFSPLKLLANLTMVQAWIPLREFNFSFVGPSWSISTEFGFYLCFLWLVRDWGRTWWWKLALSAFCTAEMILLANLLPGHVPSATDEDLRLSLVYIHPLARIFEFTLGMAAAHFFRRAAPKIKTGIAIGTLVEVAAIALAVFVMAHAIPWALASARTPWIGLAGMQWLLHGGFACVPLALLIVVMALDRGIISRVLATPLLVLLGEISYSCYLIHQTLLVHAQSHWRAFAFIPDWAILALFLALLLVSAYWVWAVIERPCRHWLVSLWPTPTNAMLVELPASMITPDGVPVKTRRTSLLLPSRIGIVAASAILAVLLAGCFYVLKIRFSVQTISAADAGRLTERTQEDLRGVRFGDRFILLGAECRQEKGRTVLDLAWQSIGVQRLEYHTAVHLTDETGKIRGQADFDQDSRASEVQPGMIWRDVITLPADKIAGSTDVAIGLLRGNDWLPADRGPRDWGNQRLLIPIQRGGEDEERIHHDGFCEVANCEEIIGWVWDWKEDETKLTVEIIEGTQQIATARAEIFRPDLLAAEIGDGKHGFRLPMPAQLKDGKPHTVHFRVVGAKFELKGSPRTIQCAEAAK